MTARIKHARATALATPLKESERLTVTRVPPARNTSAPAGEIDIDQAIDYRLCILRLLDLEPRPYARRLRFPTTAHREQRPAMTRAACLAPQRSSLGPRCSLRAGVHLANQPSTLIAEVIVSSSVRRDSHLVSITLSVWSDIPSP